MVKNQFSFVVAAYNEEEFIERCLKSIFNQTIKDFEVIVVDDGSVDDTADIVSKYDAILIRQNNTGVASALNRGIERARGDILCIVGADDFICPEYLEKNLEPFLNDNVVGVLPAMEYQTPLTIVGRTALYYRKIFLMRNKTHFDSPMLWRRFVFDDLSFNESLVTGEDHDLWRRAQAIGAEKKWKFELGAGIYYFGDVPDTIMKVLRKCFWYGRGFLKSARTYWIQILLVFYLSSIPFFFFVFVFTLNHFLVLFLVPFLFSWIIVIAKTLRSHKFNSYAFLIPPFLVLESFGHVAGILYSFFQEVKNVLKRRIRLRSRSA
jgi:glycosyltransferase involved in cell wall biosynthesis